MRIRTKELILLNIDFFSYENDRYNNAGNGRNYREQDYQQGQRNDNYNNYSGRRPNNYPSGNANRGHRATGGKF